MLLYGSADCSYTSTLAVRQSLVALAAHLAVKYHYNTSRRKQSSRDALPSPVFLANNIACNLILDQLMNLISVGRLCRCLQPWLCRLAVVVILPVEAHSPRRAEDAYKQCLRMFNRIG